MNATIDSEKKNLSVEKSTLALGSAFAIPYANRDQARRGIPEQSDFYFPLEGNWQAISNPSPADKYRCLIDLPASWEGKRVFAQLMEVETPLQLWVNGQEITPALDQIGAAAFDLTTSLHPGVNQLEVQVPFGNEPLGFLWALGAIHIRNFQVTTTPATGDQPIGWEIAIQAAMRNQSTQLALNHRIETMLFDDRGIPVWIGPLGVMVSIDPGAETPAAFSYQVKKARPWSPEDPYLYTLILEMRDADGTLLDLRSVQVGFR